MSAIGATVNGHLVTVHFRHVVFINQSRFRGMTEAVVTVHHPTAPALSEVHTDATVCAHGDTFVKERGRKVSLGRALRKAFPGRAPARIEQRRAVWAAYFSRR
jgi:hypothetical protein